MKTRVSLRFRSKMAKKPTPKRGRVGKHRTVVIEQGVSLIGEVNEEMVTEFFQAISGYDPAQPLAVLISSVGGAVDDGLAIYDALRLWPGHVTTIGYGLVGSIAVPIFCAGDQRLLTPNSRILIHPTSAEMSGPIGQIKDYYTSLQSQERRVNAVITERVVGDKLEAAKLIDKLSARESFLSAEQTAEMGIATMVLEFPVKK